VELTDIPSSPTSRSRAWLLASRPKTLWAAVVPVLIGTTLAYADNGVHWTAAGCALLGALAIQIGTNFVNDYSDHAKGADTVARKGPVRVTQAGLLSAKSVTTGAVLSFLVATLAGAYLIFRGGWPVLAIGILSITSGFLYTGGPKPFGYLGLGDLFVLVFFGPVAVAGTYFVQVLDVNWVVIVAGLAPGLLAVALLSVNNLRDVEEDAAAGKRTLAVRFGTRFARWEYITSVLAAAGIPVVLFAVTGLRPWTLSCLVIVAVATPSFRTLLAGTQGRELIPLLGSTAKLSILYSILFSLTWVI
jgi:1,4-dihydroxy-2-naphthoate octaprenyltransferase